MRILLVLAMAIVLAVSACTGQPPTKPSEARDLDVTPVADDGPIASPEPDWPQWNGPRRDGISSEKGLLPVWPETGPRLALEDRQPGTRLVVADHRPRPTVHYRRRGRRPGDLRLRPRRQAALAGEERPLVDRLLPRRKGLLCLLRRQALPHERPRPRGCLEADTGKELWAVDVLERFQGQNITWAMSECLLVDGSRVIVTPGGEKALMAALDKESGRTVWTTEPLHEDRASHCVAASVPPCGAADHRQLLLGARLRGGCRHREAALDGAAAKPLRRQRRHARLWRRQDLLHDSVRLRNLLPVAAGRKGGPQPRRHGARPWTPARARCCSWTGCSTAAATRSTSRGLPGLEVGRDPLRVQGLDDRGGRVCRRAAVLPGRGRPSSPAATLGGTIQRGWSFQARAADRA